MSGEAGNPHAGLEIGRTLERAREKRGLSLQQVEEATKIRTRYLRDLENENFEVLPAVYMLGSLKTYAQHLGLDGAAMTRELKRRQAFLQQEQDQPREDPPSGESPGLLASLGRLVGITGTVEDEAGTMAPVRRPGLYMSLAVVLIFVLVTYFVSTISGEDQPSVSVVQEPTVSQLPSGIALLGNVEDEERNTEDPNKANQPEKQAGSPTVDTGNAERTGGAERGGLEEYPSGTAQVSASATVSASASASASVSASASASAASSGSASASATATPPPTRARPAPAVREQPDGGDMAAPAGPPVRVSGSQSGQEKRAGPVEDTRLGDAVPNTVKKAVDSVR